MFGSTEFCRLPRSQHHFFLEIGHQVALSGRAGLGVDEALVGAGRFAGAGAGRAGRTRTRVAGILQIPRRRRTVLGRFVVDLVRSEHGREKTNRQKRYVSTWVENEGMGERENTKQRKKANDWSPSRGLDIE